MYTKEQLVRLLTNYNIAYRNGNPLIEDREYDLFVESLRELDPNNDYFNKVEPEVWRRKIKIKHPSPMLSIDKVYTTEALEKFIKRINKAAEHLNIENPFISITPKLDGLAGRDSSSVFVTRGDGIEGYEISDAFLKGVIPISGRGLGLGEIVIVKSYFEEHMSEYFKHPRNMVVGIITSHVVNEHAMDALSDKKVHFVPYVELKSWRCRIDSLIRDLPKIRKFVSKIDYPIDGMVCAVLDDRIREYLGSNNHSHKWQVAIKDVNDSAIADVTSIEWKLGATGRVTPTIIINPIELSGAVIRRVNGYNAGYISKNRIGVGSKIEIIRAGEVIPKLVSVIEPSDISYIPIKCPKCCGMLNINNNYLECNSPTCDRA